MKNLLLLLFTVFFLVTSCDTTKTDETMQDQVVLKSAQKVMNFRTHLSGENEVPMVDSDATGQAIFQLSKDGMELSFKLIVANIEDVLAAHIHLAPAGTNGGVVAALYTGGLIEGRTNGILAEGVITADNLTGSLEGKPLWSLVEAMMDDGTYVNVHTSANPPGELRGQISGN